MSARVHSHPRAASTAVRAAGVVVLLLVSGAAALAQTLPTDYEGKVVADVVPLLPDNHRTQKAQVISTIKIRPGAKYSSTTVNEDLRNLIKTYSFDINSTVEAIPTGDGKVKVFFHLIEMPGLVKEVIYKGNKHVKDKDLETAISTSSVRKGGPMSPSQNRLACQEIIRYYQDKGRLLATCYLEEGDKVSDTRVVFNITEGPVARVGSVEFQGHHFVSGARLKTQIHTSEQFLHIIGGTYNPAMTDADVLELKKYYQSFGFHDVQVSRELRWDDDLKHVKIIFHINEGQQYRVAAVAVDGNSYVKEDELLRFVKLRPGEIYNEGVVKADTSMIGSYYGYRGRDVSPDPKVFYPPDRPGEVDVTYTVQERPPAKVGQVKIVGNTVTRDNVILRQIPLYPGQTLTYPDLRLGEKNLARLNIFEMKPDQGIKPTLSVLDPDSPTEYKDILVTVQETPTGSLLFGVGANSNSGLTGSIVLNERNFDITRLPTSWDDIWGGRAFRGGGQEFRIEAMPGTQFQRYTISFREPFLFDSPYGLGTSAYYYNRIFTEYTESRVGGQISLSRQFNPVWSAALRTRIEQIGVHNVPPFAPEDYLLVAGNSNFALGLGGNVKRDTRDSFLRPTEGSVLDLGFEEVLGTFTYPIGTGSLSKYFTTYQRPDGSGRHVLAARSQVTVSGSHTPVYDRQFAGGFQTIRGFQFRGVGPNIDGFMVGGNFMLLNSLEYQIPLRANDQIYFVGFIDSGTVESDVKITNYRVTAGLGLRVVVPMLGPMPIALDFGFPISQASTDREQIFNFWVGYFH